MVWLPTFLLEHGASTAAAATATALMVLANIPGNLAGGWLLSHGFARSRLGPHRLRALRRHARSACSSTALLTACASRWYSSFRCCAGVIPASVFAGLPVHAPTPQHIATGNGMVLQFSNVGQFFGPLAIAWIASRFGGWEATLWVLLAFAAIGAPAAPRSACIEKQRV